MLGFFSFETSPCHHVSTADMMVFCYMFPPKNNTWILACGLLPWQAPPHPYPLYTPKIHANTKNHRVSHRNCCGYIKCVAFTVLYIWEIKLIWFQPVIIYRFDIYIYDICYIYMIYVYIYDICIYIYDMYIYI